MYSDVNKRAEGGHIGHDARQLESGLQVLEFIDAFGKRKSFELLAWVAPRLRQLVHNGGERGKPDRTGDVAVEFYSFARSIIAHQIAHGTTAICRHAIHNRVTFGMYCAWIQWLCGLSDPA